MKFFVLKILIKEVCITKPVYPKKKTVKNYRQYVLDPYV